MGFTVPLGPCKDLDGKQNLNTFLVFLVQTWLKFTLSYNPVQTGIKLSKFFQEFQASQRIYLEIPKLGLGNPLKVQFLVTHTTPVPEKK